MAVVGVERKRITQRYVQIVAAPSGGGSLVAADDAGWFSDDPAVQRALGERYRQSGRTELPFVTYMIVGQSTPIGINEYGAAYKVVLALQGQGYTISSHDDRKYVLERSDPNAPDDPGPAAEIMVIEPAQMGCARWLRRLMGRRRRSG